MLSKKEELLLEHIGQEMLSTGKYPSYARMMDLMGYKSKRSIFLLINSLVEKGYLIKNADSKIRLTTRSNSQNSIDTVDVPLVGNVACGIPILADENTEAVFSISTQIAKSDHKYFLLRAQGNSMNKSSGHQTSIDHGDLVLIRSQSSAEDGDWILAIINNEATIKEFQRLENHIVLIPHSDEESHKPIIVTEDLIIQGIVVDVFKGLDKLQL